MIDIILREAALLACRFRHEKLAVGTEEVCPDWLQHNCREKHCRLRHIEENIEESGTSSIQCKWENQPSGCLNWDCSYRHQMPKRDEMDEFDIESKDEALQLAEERMELFEGMDVIDSWIDEENGNNEEGTDSKLSPRQLVQRARFRTSREAERNRRISKLLEERKEKNEMNKQQNERKKQEKDKTEKPADKVFSIKAPANASKADLNELMKKLQGIASTNVKLRVVLAEEENNRRRVEVSKRIAQKKLDLKNDSDKRTRAREERIRERSHDTRNPLVRKRATYSPPVKRNDARTRASKSSYRRRDSSHMHTTRSPLRRHDSYHHSSKSSPLRKDRFRACGTNSPPVRRNESHNYATKSPLISKEKNPQQQSSSDRNRDVVNQQHEEDIQNQVKKTEKLDDSKKVESRKHDRIPLAIDRDKTFTVSKTIQLGDIDKGDSEKMFLMYDKDATSNYTNSDECVSNKKSFSDEKTLEGFCYEMPRSPSPDMFGKLELKKTIKIDETGKLVESRVMVRDSNEEKSKLLKNLLEYAETGDSNVEFPTESALGTLQSAYNDVGQNDKCENVEEGEEFVRHVYINKESESDLVSVCDEIVRKNYPSNDSKISGNNKTERPLREVMYTEAVEDLTNGMAHRESTKSWTNEDEEDLQLLLQRKKQLVPDIQHSPMEREEEWRKEDEYRLFQLMKKRKLDHDIAQKWEEELLLMERQKNNRLVSLSNKKFFPSSNRAEKRRRSRSPWEHGNNFSPDRRSRHEGRRRSRSRRRLQRSRSKSFSMSPEPETSRAYWSDRDIPIWYPKRRRRRYSSSSSSFVSSRSRSPSRPKEKESFLTEIMNKLDAMDKAKRNLQPPPDFARQVINPYSFPHLAPYVVPDAMQCGVTPPYPPPNAFPPLNIPPPNYQLDPNIAAHTGPYARPSISAHPFPDMSQAPGANLLPELELTTQPGGFSNPSMEMPPVGFPSLGVEIPPITSNFVAISPSLKMTPSPSQLIEVQRIPLKQTAKQSNRNTSPVVIVIDEDNPEEKLVTAPKIKINLLQKPRESEMPDQISKKILPVLSNINPVNKITKLFAEKKISLTSFLEASMHDDLETVSIEPESENKCGATADEIVSRCQAKIDKLKRNTLAAGGRFILDPGWIGCNQVFKAALFKHSCSLLYSYPPEQTKIDQQATENGKYSRITSKSLVPAERSAVSQLTRGIPSLTAALRHQRVVDLTAPSGSVKVEAEPQPSTTNESIDTTASRSNQPVPSPSNLSLQNLNSSVLEPSRTTKCNQQIISSNLSSQNQKSSAPKSRSGVNPFYSSDDQKVFADPYYSYVNIKQDQDIYSQSDNKKENRHSELPEALAWNSRNNSSTTKAVYRVYENLKSIQQSPKMPVDSRMQDADNLIFAGTKQASFASKSLYINPSPPSDINTKLRNVPQIFSQNEDLGSNLKSKGEMVPTCKNTPESTQPADAEPKLYKGTLAVPPKLMAAIQQLQQFDPSLKSHITALKSGRKVPGFVLQDNMLYCVPLSKKVQLVVPKVLTEVVMKHFHTLMSGGHYSYKNTLNAIDEHFFWPGLDADIRNFISTCETCTSWKIKVSSSKNKRLRVETYGKTSPPNVSKPQQESIIIKSGVAKAKLE